LAAAVIREVARGHQKTSASKAPGLSEDMRAPLDARVDKLEGIVFHARLGSVREKSSTRSTPSAPTSSTSRRRRAPIGVSISKCRHRELHR
jgi:hypothetical protein